MGGLNYQLWGGGRMKAELAELVTQHAGELRDSDSGMTVGAMERHGHKMRTDGGSIIVQKLSPSASDSASCSSTSFGHHTFEG